MLYCTRAGKAYYKGFLKEGVITDPLTYRLQLIMNHPRKAHESPFEIPVQEDEFFPINISAFDPSQKDFQYQKDSEEYE